jgi:hypothetical protein
MKNGKDVIKIEKGVPLPETRWATKQPLVLAMMKMKDGDSFLYPISKRPYVSYAARKAGIVVSTRTIDPANIRVWRVKPRPLAQR